MSPSDDEEVGSSIQSSQVDNRSDADDNNFSEDNYESVLSCQMDKLDKASESDGSQHWPSDCSDDNEDGKFDSVHSGDEKSSNSQGLSAQVIAKITRRSVGESRKRKVEVAVSKNRTKLRRIAHCKDDSGETYYRNRISNVPQLRQNFDDHFVEDWGFRVPRQLWECLFDFQKEGVKWLWSLHTQHSGGILGDEMGLGKSLQLIAYLSALSVSNLPNEHTSYDGLGPTLIVCPATLLFQWVEEFRKWAPRFRVIVFHETSINRKKKRDVLVRMARNRGVIIVVSYGGLLNDINLIADVRWHYVILDEGHRIRNPDSKITVACKLLATPHRLILSGTPMQNNLKELWSLVDFVFPGKLGTLETFMSSFAQPIIRGGYINADKLEVNTSQKVASCLRDIIKPCILRRLKSKNNDSLNLPEKDEKVLFCRMSSAQIKLYKAYIRSDKCKMIIAEGLKTFAGISYLRRLCNHPRLVEEDASDLDGLAESYSLVNSSGKMIVVKSLLKLWKKQNDKVLLFSQSTRLLDIVEEFVGSKYKYLRMDGSTPTAQRQSLVKRFNDKSGNEFVFLLTTRVGGVGLNLISANKVIIYDPDWNPSVDIQARERAYRIGQNSDVTIYRLLTSCSIEEKIYHRQIYKEFLTDRIMDNPKQRRFFKFENLHDLFSLEDDKQIASGKTETQRLFDGTGCNIISSHRQAKRQAGKSVRPAKLEEAGWSGMMIRGVDHEESCSDFIKGVVAEQHENKAAVACDATETYILAKLLKKNKVQCAVEHESLGNARNVDEDSWVEKETSVRAKEAVKRLKASRRYCYAASSGIPNYGSTASILSPKNHRFQVLRNDDSSLSSADLLAQIRTNSLQSPSTGLSANSSLAAGETSNPSSLEISGVDAALSNDIMEFLRDKTYGCSSEQIIDQFHSKITNRCKFKFILRELAELQQKPIGALSSKAVWILKIKYQSANIKY